MPCDESGPYREKMRPSSAKAPEPERGRMRRNSPKPSGRPIRRRKSESREPAAEARPLASKSSTAKSTARR